MTIQFLNHIIFSYMPALFVDSRSCPKYLVGPLEPSGTPGVPELRRVQAAPPWFVMVK